jgi:hypothetical protein
VKTLLLQRDQRPAVLGGVRQQIPDGSVDHIGAKDTGIIDSEFNFYLRHYAKPNTTPRIRKAKYTLWAEWTITPIQVLRKRQLGNVYRKTPLMTDPGIPQGW